MATYVGHLSDVMRLHSKLCDLLFPGAGTDAAWCVRGRVLNYLGTTTRKRWRRAALAASIAIGIISSAVITAWYRQCTHVPRLTIDETRLDLGDGKPNEILRGTLRLSNAGRAPLEFTIERSCGCTEVSPSNGTIAPGETGGIAIGVQLREHSNSERTVSATIRTNDTRQPAVRCEIIARCPPQFRVEPPSANMGTLVCGQIDGAVREINVFANPPTTPSLDDLEVKCASTAFQCKTVLISSDHVRILLKPLIDLACGDHYGSLQLRLEDCESIQMVPIHVHVEDLVSVVPSTVFLRENSPGEVSKPIDLLVIDRRKGVPPLGALELVGAPADLALDDSSNARGRVRRIRLTPNPNSTIAFPDKLLLQFADYSEPLAVRIVASR
jgi:hypothetical protein